MEQNGKLALNGVLVITLSTAFCKLVALAAQMITATYLSPGEFGVYAIIISINTMLLFFRGSGIPMYLVQHSGDYKRYQRPVRRLVHYTNYIGLAVGLALVPVLSLYVYHIEGLGWLLALSFLTIPLAGQASYLEAVQQLQFKFGYISLVNAAAAVLGNVIMVAMLICGAGVYSIVTGTIVTFLMIILMYRRRDIREESGETGVRMMSIVHDVKWAMVGTLAQALLFRADTLIAGAFLAQAALGYYSFAITVSFAVYALASMSVSKVIYPVFSKINAEKKEQLGAAFVRALNCYLLSCGFLTLALASAGPFAIHFLWGDKWTQAVPTTVLMLLAVPYQLLSVVGLSLMQSLGRWRAVGLFSAGALVVFGLSSFAVVFVKDIFLLACITTASRSLLFVGLTLFAAGMCRAFRQTLLSIAVYTGILAASVLGSLYVMKRAGAESPSGLFLPACLFFALLAILFRRKDVAYVLSLAGRIASKFCRPAAKLQPLS